MVPDLCIYHAPCVDGFGAAWAVWKRWGLSVDFFRGVYGEDPPDVTGQHVLIVDFSYPRPVLEAMGQTAASITILDHHKTAATDLAPFTLTADQPVSADNIATLRAPAGYAEHRICAVFDETRSGAALAFNFCFPGQPMPKLIAHVQDRDLWKFKLPFTREVHACLSSHPYEFALWDNLVREAEDPALMVRLIGDGIAIKRKHDKDIGELLERGWRSMRIGGELVPVANLPYTMASDAAHRMAQNTPFAACYFDAWNVRVFSLRSRPDGADVAAVAQRYGGGGHRTAAGFQVPIGWEGDVL